LVFHSPDEGAAGFSEKDGTLYAHQFGLLEQLHGQPPGFVVADIEKDAVEHGC